MTPSAMQRPSLTVAIALTSVLLQLGCASTQSPEPQPPRRVDASSILLTFLAEQDPWFQAPERPPEALRSALRGASAEERRALTAQIALGHLFAAEIASADEARTHRRHAQVWARRARGMHRHAADQARLSFVELFSAWRSGAGSAPALARRFTRRHEDATPYVQATFMLQGELAFAQEDWEDAKASFRYVLGDLEHPLYGYALFRSAFCLGNLGRESEAMDALRYVQGLGCRPSVRPRDEDVAAVAAQALHIPLDRCDDRWVPRTCGCEG